TVRPARAPSALLPLALLGLLAGACRRESATRLVRFIAAPGSGSTAALARAEIAGESRYVLAAHPPIVLRARAEVQLPPAEALRGQRGLLTVSARPLPASPREQSKTAEVDVPPGARLVFGYGVEEAGWAAGFPPVRFALAAGDATLFERRLDPAADARDRRW